MKKLWEDIQLIYEGLNFSEKMIVDGLMIMPKDNYYSIYYKSNDSITYIRIEKDYNLVRMWGGDVPYDMTNYKIYVEVDGKIWQKDENYKIELAYKVITPHLREVKLLQLEINN